MPVTRRTETASASAHKNVEFGTGKGHRHDLGGLEAKKFALSPATKAVADAVGKAQEGGDGSFALAFHMAPKDLKELLKTDEGLHKLAFDLVVGKGNGARSEYGDFDVKDVGRKGGFKVLGTMLYANGGTDDASYRGTPERKALDKSMGALLDHMLADPGTTKVFNADPGDAGYGGFHGLIAVNENTGNISAFVNTWAP